MKRKNMAKFSGIALMLYSVFASAASPVGYWEITSYVEPNLAFGVANKVCFLSNGTWTSYTFPGANGTWFQKGDRLRTTAYSPQNQWMHGLFGQFANNNEFTGEYIGFVLNGNTVQTTEKGNFIAKRAGRACPVL
ncbi:MAG: hypothetical protein CTY16_14955 [Methylobacter sp.]|uniref:hypothetical protein n=1 Tax=Methylovulum miyakonense TaxID=645578 RepID=UPI000366C1B6|nr:hypothetical protein [Methylovulum miyakonense]PPD42185.1 MAG: hypothetical protein CTY16_14955 [Methylobacter sp.]